MPQILHLGTIRRDHTDIDALVKHALLTDLCNIILQRFQGQFRFAFIHSPEILADELFVKAQALTLIVYFLSIRNVS